MCEPAFVDECNSTGGREYLKYHFLRTVLRILDIIPFLTVAGEKSEASLTFTNACIYKLINRGHEFECNPSPKGHELMILCIATHLYTSGDGHTWHSKHYQNKVPIKPNSVNKPTRKCKIRSRDISAFDHENEWYTFTITMDGNPHATMQCFSSSIQEAPVSAPTEIKQKLPP